MHPGVAKVGARGTGVDLGGVELRVGTTDMHRWAGLGQLDGRGCEQTGGIGDLDDEQASARGAPDHDPRGGVAFAEFDDDAPTVEVEMLTEVFSGGLRGARADDEAHVAGADIAEEACGGRGVGRSGECPAVGFGQVQVQAAIPADHRGQIAAADGHGLPRLGGGGRVEHVIARDDGLVVDEPLTVLETDGLARICHGDGSLNCITPREGGFGAIYRTVGVGSIWVGARQQRCGSGLSRGSRRLPGPDA
ncbi:MAG: hypothetical protein CMJ49_05840 [Planctomycetaceae bacterium]|nr:hypothetical protein [Planctomycetaceae bacterium]